MEVHGGVAWQAKIWTDDHPEVEGAMESVYIRLTARNSQGMAEEAMEYLVDLFAKGRVCVFRVRPEFNCETDFRTKVTTWSGVARFHYLRQSGEWSDAERLVSVPLSKL